MDWKNLEAMAPRNVIHAEKCCQRKAREPHGKKAKQTLQQRNKEGPIDFSKA